MDRNQQPISMPLERVDSNYLQLSPYAQKCMNLRMRHKTLCRTKKFMGETWWWPCTGIFSVYMITVITLNHNYDDCCLKKSAPSSTSSVLIFPLWAISILYTLFEQTSPNLLSSPRKPSVVKSLSRNSFSCTYHIKQQCKYHHFYHCLQVRRKNRQGILHGNQKINRKRKIFIIKFALVSLILFCFLFPNECLVTSYIDIYAQWNTNTQTVHSQFWLGFAPTNFFTDLFIYLWADNLPNCFPVENPSKTNISLKVPAYPFPQ